MLKEVATERVARAEPSFVTAGDPRAAFDQVVLVVEGRRCEIIVQWMHIKPWEWVGGGFHPLPHVAHHIEPLAVLESRDRARRGAVI